MSSYALFIGWKIGERVLSKISDYNYMLSSIIMILVGLKMLYDSFKSSDEKMVSTIGANLNLFSLAIALNLDALAIGAGFSLVKELDIFFVLKTLALTTFILAILGSYLGYRLGSYLPCRFRYLGGAILVLFGFLSFFK